MSQPGLRYLRRRRGVVTRTGKYHSRRERPALLAMPTERILLQQPGRNMCIPTQSTIIYQQEEVYKGDTASSSLPLLD
jgi:hypothetical protein